MIGQQANLVALPLASVKAFKMYDKKKKRGFALQDMNPHE